MIRVSELSRNYGDLTAVDRVSFEIGQGEIVGLLGHNGAGKTTIMKMLTGFLEPTGGSIEVNGLDMDSHRLEVQQGIGYLPENDPLYPEMTVIDYLDFSAQLHGVDASEKNRRIKHAIDMTELISKAADPIATLSRGYRQRVGVAQAILHGPGVLILDEPTNGLDPTQVQHMRDLIRSLAEKSTVILSTHILQEVQAVCDRLIIIRNGRKALDATMQELRAAKRLLVAVDREPVSGLDFFQGLAPVASVELIDSLDDVRRYALELTDQLEVNSAAADIAQSIVAAGIKLFGLHPETRDLETIFGEISAQ